MLCVLAIFLIMVPHPPISTLFPYTTLFRSKKNDGSDTASAETSRLSSSRRVTVLMMQGAWVKPISSSVRSEEHTSELQSRGHLVCRLLLEKKKKHRAV